MSAIYGVGYGSWEGYVGYGDGHVYGRGNGDGSANGSGDGYGDGDGDFYGHGDGYGDGDGLGGAYAAGYPEQGIGGPRAALVSCAAREQIDGASIADLTALAVA